MMSHMPSVPVTVSALVILVAVLLARSIDLSARRQYGAEFLWTTWGLVALGVVAMAMLFRQRSVA